MNVFVPYDAASAHENHLTRAFLIVLRAVPVAHAAWHELVRQFHRQNKSPEDGREDLAPLKDQQPTAVETQRAHVPEGVDRVVSVLQTGVGSASTTSVGASDRRQVLDGLILYGTELAIVIENKPHGAGGSRQHLEVNVGASENVVDPTSVTLEWAAIVRAWNTLLDDGRLAVAEAVLLGDFLDVVEATHPHLLPYSTVKSCGRHRGRLERRCRLLLEAIGGSENVHSHRGWMQHIGLAVGQAATKLALGAGPGDQPAAIRLEVAPGDTIAQARRLYATVNEEAVSALVETGWAVRPNLHFAFIHSNLHWTHCSLPVSEYVRFWRTGGQGQRWVKKVNRADFSDLLDALIHARVATEDDRAAFDQIVGQSSRKTINVCPGLSCSLEIPLDRAAQLDEDDRLVSLVEENFKAVTTALGLTWPARTPTTTLS